MLKFIKKDDPDKKVVMTEDDSGQINVIREETDSKSDIKDEDEGK